MATRSLQDIEKDIEQAISNDPENDKIKEVIKWVPVKYFSDYLDDKGNFKGIFVSDKGTWGKGIYVTPDDYPVSCIHYGRIALKGKVNLKRCFDASVKTNQDNFLQWAQKKRPNLLQNIINIFDPSIYLSPIKDQFKKDCIINTIIFNPDQFADGITYKDDVWYLIWDDDFMDDPVIKYSDIIKDIEWWLISSDEFETIDKDKKIYRGILGERVSIFKRSFTGKPTLYDILSDLSKIKSEKHYLSIEN